MVIHIGAGGTIGMDVVAKTPPDGYTILFGAGHMAIAPSLFKIRRWFEVLTAGRH